mgnify:CR=1 FL=1
MAVLSKIRQRSLLLILVIGFCLLAFIVGDIINSGGFGGRSRNVGSINGEDIPVQSFLERVNNMQRSQQGVTPTQASNAVWNQEVENILFAEKFEKAGLRVGKDHVINMYSMDPQIRQNPQFLNALGQFDKAKFNSFLIEMRSSNPDQYEMIERNRPLVETAAKKQLYITMLKAGFVTTVAEGKQKYEAENNKVTFDYVFVPYNTINDDQVTVTDQEIRDYMKKNEKKYKSEASREIDYVLIENKPSAADEAEMRGSINKLLNEFKRDSVSVQEFVNANSDIQFDTTYVLKKELPLEHSEQIFKLNKGEVYGPYIDNGYYKLSKVVNRRPNATANVRHILIAYEGAMRANPEITLTKEEAKAKADGLLKQINSNPASFADLAKENSDDPGSKDKGGQYEDVMPGMMVKPFNDFVFNNPTGKTGVVETDFGYHVIKVEEKSEAVQIGTVAQLIQPSEQTSDDLYAKSSKLEIDAEKGDFEALAKEMGYTVAPATKVMANDENIQGVGNQRGVVKWAFDKDTDEGDVKKFDIPQGYVLVRLKAKNEKGLLPVSDAKERVLPILRDKKKADLVKKNMEGSTLEEVSQKSGSKVSNATDVAVASPMVPGVGSEPAVVGKAFALGEGNTSGLIEGKLGVFMIKTKAVTKAAELPNYNTYITRTQQQGRAGIQTRITNALRENADIEDNRADFN